MSDMNQESELMHRISQSDERAFEQLFRAYYARLVVFARKYVTDHDLAQSIVQSVFVKIWEKREILQVTKPSAYLLIAVRNNCLNELKQQKILVSTDDKYVGIYDLPENDLPSEELADKVQNVISEMPAQRQKIFRMNRFDGLKYKEIAVALNLSIKTVEAQMGKALQFLRETLPKVIEPESSG